MYIATSRKFTEVKMVRSSLLLYSLCAASALFSETIATNEEVAMLKTTPCDASPETTISTVKERVALLESQMQDVFTDTTLGDFGAKTASARPQIHSNRLFVKTDAFMWKAYFGGSDYAATNAHINRNANPTHTARVANFSRHAVSVRTQPARDFD